MKDTNKAADLIIAIAIIIISVIFYITAGKLPEAERGIGPGDYPKVICYVLFALGVIQIVKIIATCKCIPLIDWKNINVKYLVRAAIMALMTYIYYLLIKKVGFLLLTPLYLFGGFMLFGYKKKIKAAIIAVVFSTCIYFLFVNVFLVILPRGILG